MGTPDGAPALAAIHVNERQADRFIEQLAALEADLLRIVTD
jgi:hypothetical protein